MRVEPGPMFVTTVVVNLSTTVVVEGVLVVTIEVEIEVDATVEVECEVNVTVVRGGVVAAGVTVTVEKTVNVVTTDTGGEDRITLQISLPPISKMVLEILLHTRRFPNANTNPVVASPFTALDEPESIVCRQA